jgi:ATP-dependent DNA ligase
MGSRIKFDGYRVQVHLHNEAVKVFTRRGYDWTSRFKRSRRMRHISAGSAIIDAEVVVPAAEPRRIFPSCKMSSKAHKKSSSL